MIVRHDLEQSLGKLVIFCIGTTEIERNVLLRGVAIEARTEPDPLRLGHRQSLSRLALGFRS
jgi:hypothetical protein